MYNKVDFVINEMAFPEGDIVDYAECIEVTISISLQLICLNSEL